MYGSQSENISVRMEKTCVRLPTSNTVCLAITRKRNSALRIVAMTLALASTLASTSTSTSLFLRVCTISAAYSEFNPTRHPSSSPPAPHANSPLRPSRIQRTSILTFPSPSHKPTVSPLNRTSRYQPPISPQQRSPGQPSRHRSRGPIQSHKPSWR